MKSLSKRAMVLIAAGLVASVAVVVYAVSQTWIDGFVFAGVANNNVPGGGGGYKVYTNGGGEVEFVSDPAYLAQISYTTGCAFNPAKTFLYTTEFSNGRLAVYNNITPHSLNTINTQRSNPESIVFHPDGRFFVGGPGVPNFEEYTAGGAFSALHTLTLPDATADATGGTDWMDLAGDGKTMFITDEGAKIMRFDLQTDTQIADFVALLPNSGAYALRVLSDGGVLVANRLVVRQFNSSGVQVATYDATGEDDFFALNLDADGTHFWTGGYVSGIIYKFTINPGTNLDNQVQTVDSGVREGRLAGLCVRGEITAAVPSGTFVIGDVEPHGLGMNVNFWGAQWWKNNDMSGTATAGHQSFKGWATSSDNFCGGTWVSRPGNSSNPPATVSNPLTIVVTDSVIKSGPNITGNIKQIITVNPSAGYGPNPGHAGNGVVTSVTCPQ